VGQFSTGGVGQFYSDANSAIKNRKRPAADPQSRSAVDWPRDCRPQLKTGSFEALIWTKRIILALENFFMPIRFKASITPSVNRTLTRRYMPHIKFDFSNVHFGLTFLEEVSEMVVGRTRPAHITILGHPDMAPVAENITTGLQFALYEGAQQVAAGTVNELEETTLD
jgi:hypothetical protein